MRRMLLVALVLATMGSASGCRLLGWGQGDRCNPCGFSQSNCGPSMFQDGATIVPAPVPTPTNRNVLPGPVEPTT